MKLLLAVATIVESTKKFIRVHKNNYALMNTSEKKNFLFGHLNILN